MKIDQLTKLVRKFKVWLEQNPSQGNQSGEIDITELYINELDEQIRSQIQSDNPFAFGKWIYEELLGKEQLEREWESYQAEKMEAKMEV